MTLVSLDVGLYFYLILFAALVVGFIVFLKKLNNLSMLRTLNIISGIIMGLSAFATLWGLQDCSGDGCMVRLLLVLSLPCLLLTLPVFFYTRKKLKELLLPFSLIFNQKPVLLR